MVKLLLQLKVSVSVLAIASTMVATMAGAGSPNLVPAKLLGFEREQSNLQFDVISNGCTKEADFAIEYSDNPLFEQVSDVALLNLSNEIVYLRIMRISADVCRRRPFKQTMTIPAHDILQGKQLQMTNVFVSLDRLKRE